MNTIVKDVVVDNVNDRKSNQNYHSTSKKISKRHYDTDSDSESITSNSSSSSNADHDQLDSSSVFDEDSIDSTNQPVKNKKSVQFYPIVRVRRIPPNSTYLKEKTNMFWTRLELETFKWESTYEMLYRNQYYEDYEEDEFEYPPEFTYE